MTWERCADVKVDTEALQRLMEAEDEVCLRYILKYSTRGGKLGLLQYAAVVLDFQGSKSTSCGVIGVFGIQTHVPSALICKKQTALSVSQQFPERHHFFGRRFENGRYTALLLSIVFEKTCSSYDAEGKLYAHKWQRRSLVHSIDRMSLDMVDHVPSNIPEPGFSFSTTTKQSFV